MSLQYRLHAIKETQAKGDDMCGTSPSSSPSLLAARVRNYISGGSFETLQDDKMCYEGILLLRALTGLSSAQ